MTESQNIPVLLIQLMVFSGATLLVLGLLPLHQLIGQLVPGPIRIRWRVLGILIIFFIGGYLVYGFSMSHTCNNTLDLLVPAVFFFGSLFVFLVTSLSLQTAQDFKRLATLEKENITDPLTGIYNRRYLDQRLQEEVAKSQRYSMPLAILLLDLDHFKKVNDQHGHQTGDQILTGIGDLILRTVREVDVVARYGGEEFVIIAPNTQCYAAIHLAERLRQRIEETAFTTGQAGRSIRMTTSIGVACFNVHQRTTVEELVRDADKALYAAKNGGRNQVVAYQ
ncbi:MAG: GGDEF domain-containing protein [Deltaproteobacteria bacterium]|nr:GGDEF domain-containing protein [Candidatus Anaeroferrophillacea bacterium]